MKKVLAVLMVVVFTFSLIGCGAKKEEATTPAGILVNQFLEDSKDQSLSSEDLAWKLCDHEVFEFMPMVMPMEEGWMPGFTEDIVGFKECTFFGPMISTIPFVGYIFVLDDSADAKAFVKNLEEKADLNWNVCTQADEMKSGISGNKVCFIMSKTSFEEE